MKVGTQSDKQSTSRFYYFCWFSLMVPYFHVSLVVLHVFLFEGIFQELENELSFSWPHDKTEGKTQS